MVVHDRLGSNFSIKPQSGSTFSCAARHPFLVCACTSQLTASTNEQCFVASPLSPSHPIPLSPLTSPLSTFPPSTNGRSTRLFLFPFPCRQNYRRKRSVTSPSKTLAEAALQSLQTEDVGSFDSATYIIDVVKGVLCTFRNALVWCGVSSPSDGFFKQRPV